MLRDERLSDAVYLEGGGELRHERPTPRCLEHFELRNTGERGSYNIPNLLDHNHFPLGNGYSRIDATESPLGELLFHLEEPLKYR